MNKLYCTADDCWKNYKVRFELYAKYGLQTIYCIHENYTRLTTSGADLSRLDFMQLRSVLLSQIKPVNEQPILSSMLSVCSLCPKTATEKKY